MQGLNPVDARLEAMAAQAALDAPAPLFGGTGPAVDRALAGIAKWVTTVPRNSLATIGRAAQLAVQVIWYAITGIARMRIPVVETLEQAWFLLTVTASKASPAS